LGSIPNKGYIVDGDLLVLRVGKWKVKVVKIVSDDGSSGKASTPLAGRKRKSHWRRKEAIARRRRR
jgi:hypothetical protein